MADYGKLSVRGLFSRNSDYSLPEQDTKMMQYAQTPDECIHLIRDIPTGGLNLVEAGDMTSITALIVQIKVGSGNFVTLGYTDTAANAQNPKIAINGGMIVVTDVDPSVAVTLTADTAAVECEVFILGS